VGVSPGRSWRNYNLPTEPSWWNNPIAELAPAQTDVLRLRVHRFNIKPVGPQTAFWNIGPLWSRRVYQCCSRFPSSAKITSNPYMTGCCKSAEWPNLF
jgi:hypothetical protein